MNPHSSVDFSKALESLGYITKPQKDVMFTKRNVHFAAACAPGAKAFLSEALSSLIGPRLPDDKGMVRLSNEPPNGKINEELPLLAK